MKNKKTTIKAFFIKKEELTNYELSDSHETIFNYVPLQKTNQQFTPVSKVRKMVDVLEEESPGIFSDPSKTFLDPYAKSGLFIEEVAKRLMNGLEGVIKDEGARLNHIYTKQLYAIAPSTITYQIVKNHVNRSYWHNIKHCDLTESSINNTMQETINELFGGEDMKFDVIIGNPPYQEDRKGENKNYAKPIYDRFMDESFKLATITTYITPARFLFNTGDTPKQWNEKMLNSDNFRVVEYYASGEEVFPNTSIGGGVVVTVYNNDKNSLPIEVFLSNKNLQKIYDTIHRGKEVESINNIFVLQNKFNLVNLYKDFPGAKDKIASKGNEKRLRTNIFKRLERTEVFTDGEREGCVKIYGLGEGQIRQTKYIKEEYLEQHELTKTYKVIIPKAAGGGSFGAKLTEPNVLVPGEGYTETFIGVGPFKTEQNAKSMIKYYKTKLFRAMLGILKVTQDNASSIFKYVPLQDFTDNSDIDWSQTVSEIDQQLYAKYGLTDDEINFIEEHVLPME